MRMWMVNPRVMCGRHLFGEHRELHAIIGMIKNPKLHASLKGLASRGFLELSSIYSRHQQLHTEMGLRMNKQYTSELQEVELWDTGKVDPLVSINELHTRCKQCRRRITILNLGGSNESN
jgi:hypothetical protein